MILEQLVETNALLKAVLRIPGYSTISESTVKGVVPQVLRHEPRYYDKATKHFKRDILLADLKENPYTLANLDQVGPVTETEIFQWLFATIGER